MSSLLSHLPQVRGSYKENASLQHLTWLKVGGTAEILYKPADIEDLQYFLSHVNKEIAVFILGAGSNLLVRDGGVEGVVIKLGRAFTEVQLLESNQLYCGAASLNFNAARFALEHSLSGLEFLVGIPGVIGGGVWMNAGCYGSEFKDVLVEIHTLSLDGQLQILPSNEINFQYRCSNLPQGTIVIGAVFQLRSSAREVVAQQMQEITEARKSAQPQGCRTGGSTFANPEGEKKAWQLIDAVGMRGFKIGGASFSEKHCNFLINDGSATAADLEDLGEKARKDVLDKSDIDLHWEIQRIGRRK